MDPSNINTALSSALCEELARSGMRRAVISPGSRSTPLAIALDRNPAIETTVVLDERSAGFIALGTSLASSLPVAIVTTSGSAAANLYPAVVEADEANAPLICLTADRPPELRDIGAGQTIDQIKMYGDSVRWFCEVGTHDADDAGLLYMRNLGCRAFAVASGDPRPGPVHLNLALREPLAPVPADEMIPASSPLALEGRGASPLKRTMRSSARLDAESIDDLANRIAAARRPIIVCGLNREGDKTAEDVARFAEEIGAPILAEPTSQLRWGRHDRSRVISNYDAIIRADRPEITPDLVIRIGDIPTSKPLRLWIAGGMEIDQIVLAPHFDWKEPTGVAETIVRAATGPLLDELSSRLSILPARSDWCEIWQRSQRVAGDAIESVVGPLEAPSEPGVWRILSEILKSGDRVFSASSMPIRDLEAFMPDGGEEVRFFSNRGANGIDGQISTAVGISSDGLARTFAVMGDLAFAHDQGALALLSDHPEMTLIVIDNGGGGIFDFLPVAQAIEPGEMERLFTTPSGIDPVALASSHGLDLSLPSSAQGLEDALRSQTQVVVVNTDRARNLELHREINDAVASALHEALDSPDNSAK